MPRDLERTILAALAYFDIFDRPLTERELMRFLWRPPVIPIGVSEANEADESLQQLVARNSIETKHGYFFLPGRLAIITVRERAVREVEKKLAIAARACRKLRWIPFLRAVFVCNTVAAGCPEHGSDVDVFIIVQHGRLWLTRLLATLFLSLFGLRRRGGKITNRICLSFYITDNALNLSPIALSSIQPAPNPSFLIPQPDIYLIYWLAQLIPVYDPSDTLKKLQDVNQWARQCLPQSFKPYALRADLRVSDSGASHRFKRAIEKIWAGRYCDLMEAQAKTIQQMRMNQRTKELEDGRTTGVVVNDDMLKFHENDRREEFRQLWIKRLQQLGL